MTDRALTRRQILAGAASLAGAAALPTRQALAQATPQPRSF